MSTILVCGERYKTDSLKEDFVSYALRVGVMFVDSYAGDKFKEQKEEAEREIQNQKRAGDSYASPDPGSIGTDHTLSGLPWGGISMKYIVEQGKRREHVYQQSSCLDPAYQGTFYTGTGSSR